MIVVDYDIPEDWEFHKALEDTTGEKWDIYKQILMNIDVITDVFIENIKSNKKQK